MGWSNYIVIPKWKLLIEISRDISEIADYEKTAIEKAIDEDGIDFDTHIDREDVTYMGDVPISKITIRDLSELYKSYDIVQSLSGMDYNKLLLYWLINRGIDFSIQSEHTVDMKEYMKEGYVKIGR